MKFSNTMSTTDLWQKQKMHEDAIKRVKRKKYHYRLSRLGYANKEAEVVSLIFSNQVVNNSGELLFII